jgi:hypothetical protein
MTMMHRRQSRRRIRRRSFKLLQKHNMEDVVDARLGWEPESVSERPHTLRNLERTKELRGELGVGALSDADRRAMVKSEPNLVPHLKLHVAVLLVMQ